MRLPSSWQAPPPTHLRIPLVEHLNGHPVGDRSPGMPHSSARSAGVASPFSPRKALPGEAHLVSSRSPQRNFGRWAQFEAYHNSRPDTSFSHDNASKKRFLPNQEARRNPRSSGVRFGRTRCSFCSEAHRAITKERLKQFAWS